ncbi:coatomer subunit zeta [Nematocida minor]|uniref:coatomer subunit zeta n=1 Tax=Nematocida minor TaxID=1912983 RepID=UPI00221EBCC0|nr:coatomer subunit zeta [Nematocida minor]KAI5192536.1 coatomer subunit zeta [Nematocida minor]
MCSTEVVRGLAVIGENGNRIIGSPLVVLQTEKDLEKRMFEKAKETEESIILFEDNLVLYKIVGDVCILLYAPNSGNEIALFNALDAFYSAAVKLINGPMTQKSIDKHYDEIFLLIDSFIYKTLIVTDSTADLLASIPKRTFESLESMQMPSKLSSALKKAHKSFASSWFK